MFAISSTQSTVPFELPVTLKRKRVSATATEERVKRQEIKQGKGFTKDDLVIFNTYSYLAPNCQNEIAPDALLRTIITIIKRGGEFLLTTPHDFTPSQLQEKWNELKNKPKRKLNSPYFRAVLERYSSLFPRVSTWLSAYCCMFLVQKVVKKNWDNDSFFKHITYQEEKGKILGSLVVGLLPDQNALYLAKLVGILGAGRFGVVYKVETDCLGTKALKIARSDGKNPLWREWESLHILHTPDEATAIQSKPIAFGRIQNRGLADSFEKKRGVVDTKSYLMLGECYSESLDLLLLRDPTFFKDAESVFKAFLPLFEALAYSVKERNLVHYDIKLNNILVKESDEGVKLVLADWGRALSLYSEVTEDLDYSSIKNRIEKCLLRWRIDEGAFPEAKSLPLNLEGTLEQLIELTRYVVFSREIYCLGKVLYKTLEMTICSDKTHPPWIYLRGHRSPNPDDDPPYVKKIDTFLYSVTNNYYVEQVIAGIPVEFPERATFPEAIASLKEVIHELEKT